MDRGNNNHMNRAKRNLDGNDDDDQPERKRPALARSFFILPPPSLFFPTEKFLTFSILKLVCASVIVEALKVDSLQKLCSSLEPILRRVVRDLLLLFTLNLCLLLLLLLLINVIFLSAN